MASDIRVSAMIEYMFTAFGKVGNQFKDQIEIYSDKCEKNGLNIDRVQYGCGAAIDRLSFFPSFSDFMKISIEIPSEDRVLFLEKFRALSYYRDCEMPSDVYTVYLETISDRSDESIIRAYSKLKHGIIELKDPPKSLGNGTAFYNSIIPKKREDRAAKIKFLMSDAAAAIGRGC
jgi:hypothetical protein